MQHVLLQGSEAPRSDIRGAEQQQASLVVLESRMVKQNPLRERVGVDEEAAEVECDVGR